MSYSPPAKLPPGDEIHRQYKAGATFEAIGARYNSSRQAAWKRWKKWQREDNERRAKIADELSQLTQEMVSAGEEHAP